MKENSKSARDICVINKAWGQGGWIMTEFSFCIFVDRDDIEGPKNAKKERDLFIYCKKISLYKSDLFYSRVGKEKPTVVV